MASLSLSCVDSVALLHYIKQQILLFGGIQANQTGDHLNSDTSLYNVLSVLFLNSPLTFKAVTYFRG